MLVNEINLPTPLDASRTSLVAGAIMTQFTLPVLSAVAALFAWSLPAEAEAAPASSTVAVGHDWIVRALSTSVALAAPANSSGSGSRGVLAEYESASCSDAPVMVVSQTDCSSVSAYIDDGCALLGNSGSSSEASGALGLSGTGACVDDLPSYLDQLYGDQAYVRVDYVDLDCSEFYTTNVYVADGRCHGRPFPDIMTGGSIVRSKLATIWDNGTAPISWYATLSFTKEQLSTSACQAGTVGYTSTGDDDGGLSGGAITGIVVGCVAFLAFVAGLVLWRRRRSQQNSDTGAATSTQKVGASVQGVQTPETPDQHTNPYQSAA